MNLGDYEVFIHQESDLVKGMIESTASLQIVHDNSEYFLWAAIDTTFYSDSELKTEACSVEAGAQDEALLALDSV